MRTVEYCNKKGIEDYIKYNTFDKLHKGCKMPINALNVLYLLQHEYSLPLKVFPSNQKNDVLIIHNVR